MTKLKWKKTLCYPQEITSHVPRALGGGTYAISDEGTHGFSVWLHRRVIGQTATRGEAIALAQTHFDDRLPTTSPRQVIQGSA